MMLKYCNKLISPQGSYQLAGQLSPWFFTLAGLFFSYGLYAALYLAPIDYQQGEVYRIIYIHVPAALLSLGIYVAMSIAAFILLVWRIKVMDVFCQAAAGIGAAFTIVTLVTGSIWGRPTWGTWWVWDARLSSELILLLIYLGIIALRHALADTDYAARASALLTCIGCINIPIIHYSVNWWHSLHQGASILLPGSPNIAASMLYPLLAMIMAFIFIACGWLSIEYRVQLLRRWQRRKSIANYLQQSFRENS